MTVDDERDFMQGVKDPRARLAVHKRDVRDRWILRQHAVDVFGTNLRVLCVVERREATAEHLADERDALAVGAVQRDEHMAVARHQRADRRFHREGPAALQRHAFVRAFAVHDA